uniref:Calmodulin-binding transcription activator 2 n=1 Tax=Electrophorus electricus TaxID=8005 RepID=A0AAY5EDB9_ELEEL
MYIICMCVCVPENNHQMKVFLPTKLLESLPRTSTLPKERLRWNTNEEIASYLISFDRHEEWLSCTLKARPQNGSILLYNRKKVQYRKDGYCWKKRKDGKTTREDHMKLKVQGTECLYGCYVHSSIIPTFHRRCYWLLQNPDIVLVHYLNVPSVEDSGKVCGPVLCAVTDRRDGLRWSREDLLSQLKPMFHSMKWGGSGSGAELSTEQLVQQILESQQTKPQPRTHTCLCNHGNTHTREESKAELSLTRAGSRLVLSPVPPKQDTPPPPTATSPTSPAPPPHTTSPNQGVATLSLTLLPSPVIGGLLLTDRIISDPPSAMLHAPAPCLLAPPTMSAGSASALLPFDPDSFLNSPKQGQTYGGSSLTPPIPANSASSCPSPPLSSSPEPLASLALSLSPTSPPSSLSTPNTLMHTHSAHSSPVRLKEEKSPPITPSILQDFESDETPMDTAHSSDAVPPDTEEPELSFDSTFPDLISELITEETNTQSSGFCQIPSLATPTFPIRYMVPPQPMPATSYLPYPTLTHTHTHTHSGAGEGAVCLASITDFSPEWSYPEGGVKVLITGPWSQESVRYSCVFDQSTVPASLIQAGVLRCYCPAHEAGLVALRVMKGSDTVSSSVLFEYRARNATSLPSSQLDWLSLDDNQFRMSILERLEQMERRMAEMANSNQQQQQQHLAGPWFERRIVSVCERMMQTGSWGCGGRETLTHSITHRGMTLLHLAAAQGYTQLIHTLIRWRGVGPASVSLEQEIDPLNVDHFSCTPLMWACALGHQTAAVLLYSWSSVALGIPDSLGRLPLAVARARGHTRLVHCLEELHTQKQAQELTHTLDTSAPPLLPTSPVSTSPDTGLSSSSSVPSPSDPPSPSPSSAYSSGSLHPSSPLSSPSDPMDTSSNSSPHNSPGLWDHAQEGGGTNDASGSSHNHFLMNAPSHPRSEYPHPSFETELLSYSENTENEHFLPADIIQVDMATLAEQIIEATPERIKQEDFPRGAESPLRERRDNPAIHDTLPWLAPYLDNIDSSLALQRIRPPSSAAWAEFLNASANGRMERDFALLTLTDSEQRELYEAARIIQNAFRRYKGRRQKEQQDMAAAVIQRCYRKYKQYALYKKMTQAAILIQSKFRSYYEQKRFQQSRRAAVLIQQYYRSYKEYEHLARNFSSFLTKKQDQAARKIMRFFRRCRHRYTGAPTGLRSPRLLR